MPIQKSVFSKPLSLAVTGLLLLSLTSCVAWLGLPPREARLSSAVALVYQGEPMGSFIQNPGPSFVQAYVRFDSSLPNDVIFGIDQEFIEGLRQPVYFEGGDWMALVGMQRTGVIWVAAGTADTMKGIPSKDRAWQIVPLGQPLQPNTWYRLRIEANFATRQFQSFSIQGPDIQKTINLSAYKLDYPNYMPFSDRSMGFFVFAMRSRGLMNSQASPSGPPVVYFDDVTGGPILPTGLEVVAFQSSFEQPEAIGKQPLTFPVIKLQNYVQGQWYLERDEALFKTHKVSFALSGDYVGVADASLD